MVLLSFSLERHTLAGHDRRYRASRERYDAVEAEYHSLIAQLWSSAEVNVRLVAQLEGLRARLEDVNQQCLAARFELTDALIGFVTSKTKVD
jgi:hypothetical protein